MALVFALKKYGNKKPSPIDTRKFNLSMWWGYCISYMMYLCNVKKLILKYDLLIIIMHSQYTGFWQAKQKSIFMLELPKKQTEVCLPMTYDIWLAEW